MADKLIAIDTAKAAGQQLPSVVRTEIDVLVGDHDFTAADVGLGNVDDTRDADKPVSTAQLDALNTKVNINTKGQPNGVAPLDATGHVPDELLPPGLSGDTFVDWGYCQSELAHGGWTGISDTAANVREILQGIKDSGARHVRVGAHWSRIQPTKGGAYTWTGMDRFFTVLQEFPDIEPLVCFLGKGVVPTGGTPTIAEFGLLCGAVAARYGSNGTRQLKNYEIWNEENQVANAAPFNTGATPFGPATYTSILIAASNAIRTADPQAFILMGGLLSTVTYPASPATHTDWLPSDWIAGMHDAGADPYYDGINVHYYAGAVDFSGYHEPSDDHPVYLDLTTCRNLVDSYGGGSKPFWITEMGFPQATAGLEDPRQRADWLVKQVEQVVALGFIDVWFIYNYQDTVGFSAATSYGAADSTGTPRQPMWDTFANINAITPKVPGLSVTADKLAIESGLGTAGVLNIAADGTMTVAPDATGGGGGGGAITTYGPVALPAMAADSVNTLVHNLHTDNVVPVFRRSALPTGLSYATPGQILGPDSIVCRVVDIDTVTIEPSVATADGEFLLVLMPGTPSADVTGPGAAVLSSPAKTAATIDLLLTGGTDAGIGLGGADIYRSAAGGGGSRTLAATLTRGVDTWQDTGRLGNTRYDYSAKRFDLLGRRGVESNVVQVTTDVPTVPPAFSVANKSAAYTAISDLLNPAWTIAIPALTNPGAIVYVVNSNNNIQHFHPVGTPTASVGGVALTYKGTVLMDNDDIRGFVSVWAGIGIPTGGAAKTVLTSIADTGDSNSKAYGGICVYEGVGGFGSLITGFGSGANPSVAAASAANRIVWGIIANWFTTAITPTTYTTREFNTTQPAYAAGERAGAGSAPISAGMAARGWGGALMEVLPA